MRCWERSGSGYGAVKSTGTYEDVFSIWDPNAGFAPGGSSFMLNGNRASFGLSFTMTKGKTTPRGGLVVVLHLPGAGVCRVKSNQLNSPAVNGNVVTLGGKGTTPAT